MDGLFESPLVQTAIAVISIWFVAALICSGIVQLAATFFGFKAKHLWTALGRLLTGPGTDLDPAPEGSDPDPDPGLDRKTKPIILSEAPPKTSIGAVELLTPAFDPKFVVDAAALDRFIGLLPGVAGDTLKRTSSIDKASAVEALMAAAEPGADGAVAPDFARTPLGKLVESLPESVRKDGTKLRGWFDGWFDGQMELLSVSFRSKIRWYTAFVGLVLALFLHIDSLAMVQALYSTPTTRRLVIAQVQQLGSQGDGTTLECRDEKNQKDRYEDADDANASDDDGAGRGPLGNPSRGRFPNIAQEDPSTAAEQLGCIRAYATKLESFDVAPGLAAWTAKDGRSLGRQGLGVLATAAAIAAGAPFWFDVLRRLMGLKPRPRESGPPATPATVTVVTGG